MASQQSLRIKSKAEIEKEANSYMIKKREVGNIEYLNFMGFAIRELRIVLINSNYLTGWNFFLQRWFSGTLRHKHYQVFPKLIFHGRGNWGLKWNLNDTKSSNVLNKKPSWVGLWIFFIGTQVVLTIARITLPIN